MGFPLMSNYKKKKYLSEPSSREAGHGSVLILRSGQPRTENSPAGYVLSKGHWELSGWATWVFSPHFTVQGAEAQLWLTSVSAGDAV